MVNLEFIERFQLEYKKNPRSRVFAPLAEAYRKMGMLEEAHRLCLRGVQIHPDFAGGRVAFAKVLLEMGKDEGALTQLEKAIHTSPENLLAHSLMGEVLIKLRRPKEALKSYKMVLFLNPNDEKARQTVQKWEFLSADEYEDELFAMKPVFRMKDQSTDPKIRIPPEEPLLEPISVNPQKAKALERATSLADAFTIRGDLERAIQLLVQARSQLGPASEIERRLELLARRTEGMDFTASEAQPAYGLDQKERKRQRLETFLRRIEARRLGG
jgi:tetratricopeptide (TPR) repeat protein